MLSTILWIIGGLVVLGLIIFLLKILFVALAIKKVLSVVKEEVEALPGDYKQMRKEVENESPDAKPKTSFVKKTLLRWLGRM